MQKSSTEQASDPQEWQSGAKDESSRTGVGSEFAELGQEAWLEQHRESAQAQRAALEAQRGTSDMDMQALGEGVVVGGDDDDEEGLISESVGSVSQVICWCQSRACVPVCVRRVSM